MLHYSTVESTTLSLLNKLMNLKELSTCSLVGGTALSLKYGHRKSIDIAAMKINAILGRGVKKDFFDLAELLKHINLEDIIDAYQTKYPNQHYLISIPNALTYFVEAEDSPNPMSLNNTSWDEVKNTLKNAVRTYLS